MAWSAEVQVAARVLYEREMARADHTQRVLESADGRGLPGAREREAFEEHAETTWLPDAAAALEAAAEARRASFGCSST